jgi:hypothetical protein
MIVGDLGRRRPKSPTFMERGRPRPGLQPIAEAHGTSGPEAHFASWAVKTYLNFPQIRVTVRAGALT